MSSKKANKKTGKHWDKGQQRSLQGDVLLKEDQEKDSHNNDWNLDWFKPKGLQIDCVESMEKNLYTIINGPSGCGKTSVALWFALHGLKNREYDQLIFIKNPTEVGDDKIGFLTGAEQDKLQAHYESTKVIFKNFMSANKLDNDARSGKIQLTIPNFKLGATFDNAFVIIDEAQVMSQKTIKLLTERMGHNCHFVLLGDAEQRYAITKREDGFTDFIARATLKYHGIRIPRDGGKVGYVQLSASDNQRSEGSKYINKLYAED